MIVKKIKKKFVNIEFKGNRKLIDKEKNAINIDP